MKAIDVLVSLGGEGDEISLSEVLAITAASASGAPKILALVQESWPIGVRAFVLIESEFGQRGLAIDAFNPIHINKVIVQLREKILEEAHE